MRPLSDGGLRGYAGGTFDLFHPGHLNFLKACKERCLTLIVSLNTDEFAERYKRKPIMTLDERRAMLESCRFVDQVIVNEGCEDSKPAILACGADVIFHGDDWWGRSLMEQLGIDQEWLNMHHVELTYVPYTHGISSTDVIERCRHSPQ